MGDERTVVVSGGGTGIGRAVVTQLVGDGWHVTIVGRRRQELEAVRDAPGNVAVVAADVATEAGAAMVADEIAATGRPCAGVVAAAGGASPRPEPDASLADIRRDWTTSFESNVLSAVLLVEALCARSSYSMPVAWWRCRRSLRCAVRAPGRTAR